MLNTSARYSDYVTAPDHAETYPMKNGTAGAVEQLNDDVNSPAGGVSSTIRDMTRYARLQLNSGSIDGKQVVDGAALAETHRPQIVMGISDTGMSAYGLGWEIFAQDGRVRVEHGGDLTNGAETFIRLYPAERMGIVVLANGFPDGKSLKMAVINGWDDLYFTGAVRKDYYGEADALLRELLKPGSSILNPVPPLPPAPEAPAAPRPLADYTGTYEQEYYGNIRIEANATRLLAYPGKNPVPLYLEPYDGDTFRLTDSGTGVYFTAGKSGAIESCGFASFNMPGRNGTFVKISG
jgi:hypothetical protein